MREKRSKPPPKINVEVGEKSYFLSPHFGAPEPELPRYARSTRSSRCRASSTRGGVAAAQAWGIAVRHEQCKREDGDGAAMERDREKERSKEGKR